MIRGILVAWSIVVVFACAVTWRRLDVVAIDARALRARADHLRTELDASNTTLDRLEREIERVDRLERSFGVLDCCDAGTDAGRAR